MRWRGGGFAGSVDAENDHARSILGEEEVGLSLPAQGREVGKWWRSQGRRGINIGGRGEVRLHEEDKGVG